MRKSVAVVIATTVLAGTLFGAGMLFEQWRKHPVSHLAQQRENREPELAAYYGVKFGASKDEVGYVLGYPSSVQSPFRPDPTHKGWKLSDALKINRNGNLEGSPDADEPPGGLALKKYDSWNYDLPPDRVTVDFDTDKKTAARITCMDVGAEGQKSKCRPVLGITVGSSEEDVLKALGTPEHQSIDGIFKTMSYPSLGLELKLTRTHVYLVVKTAPSKFGP